MILALRSAADALEAIDTSPEPDPAGPRAAALRIESSGSGSESHAKDLAAGLQEARGRLRGLRPAAGRAVAFEAALADLDTAVGVLAAGRPLLEQRTPTAQAFRALANAVFLAAGQDAPFAAAQGSSVVAPSVDELMDRLRSDTAALASADMRTLRTRAAEGLLSLAELVSWMGQAAEAKEIRFQAERLRRPESAPFARSDWVERGLLAALQALESYETCQSERADDWVEMARRAATDLPHHGALPFQHARLQDAFRATVDVFGVALLGERGCSGDTRSSAAAEPGRLRMETR